MPLTSLQSDQKTFVLGLGCQKGGTTWIYESLAADPKVAKGWMKEYHVWNVIEGLDRTNIFEPRFINRVNPKKLLRRRMILDTNQYFDYFFKLLAKRTVAADITPAYNGLSSATLIKIRDGFAERSIPVKVIISIREPVSRIKSAVAMRCFKLRLIQKSMTVAEQRQVYLEQLNHFWSSSGCQFRTRYEKTIERATSVFGEKNLLVAVYDQLFTDTFVNTLNEFLGTKIPTTATRRPVNARKYSGFDDSAPDIEAKIRVFYADTYRYCCKRFPAAKGWMND